MRICFITCTINFGAGVIIKVFHFKKLKQSRENYVFKNRTRPPQTVMTIGAVYFSIILFPFPEVSRNKHVLMTFPFSKPPHSITIN